MFKIFSGIKVNHRDSALVNVFYVSAATVDSGDCIVGFTVLTNKF